jgi:hypothetical protein
MSGGNAVGAAARARPAGGAAPWRQFAFITGGAVAIYFGLRLLPTGSNLNHMDFRVDAKGASVIEFCDPLNPQFIPVVAVRSPVVMSIRTAQPPVAGHVVEGVVTLKTASGKPIGPEDLLMTHTRPLHLMLTDSSLSDYQHIHPRPGRERGEWIFSFTPRHADTYRVFGDFMPAATGRGLYASVDLAVGAGPGAQGGGQSATAAVPPVGNLSRVQDGVRFTLVPAAGPLRAGRPLDFTFTVARVDGQPVALMPVMDAYAHLVAFDEARSGFAHLHPADTRMDELGAAAPVMTFKLMIPRAGRYVIWAQLNVGGEETFVPFWVDVV